MKLPVAVPLMGNRIRIQVLPRDQWPHGDDCIGLWEPQQNRISILEDIEPTARAHTFWHELLHAALDLMNNKLSANEKFVDQLSGLLHQAISQAEYPKAKRKRKA